MNISHNLNSDCVVDVLYNKNLYYLIFGSFWVKLFKPRIDRAIHACGAQSMVLYTL